jgi:hypothetical protein
MMVCSSMPSAGSRTLPVFHYNHVARWAGTGWEDVAGGTSDVVSTLGLFHGEIQVGLGISLGLASGGISGDDSAPQPGKRHAEAPHGARLGSPQSPSGQTVSTGRPRRSPRRPRVLGTAGDLARNGVALNDGDAAWFNDQRRTLVISTHELPMPVRTIASSQFVVRRPAAHAHRQQLLRSGSPATMS